MDLAPVSPGCHRFLGLQGYCGYPIYDPEVEGLPSAD